jgi:transposase
LLAESKKHKATKLLCQIPSIGLIRAALLIALIQTPHRFCAKRPLWEYSGFGIEMNSSANYRKVEDGCKIQEAVSVRGLNRDCNHNLKNLFKGAATIASVKPGPFQEFYAALVAKGMRPEMARLTLARKMATIVLIVWKRGVCFDANHLKPQTA